MIVDVEMNSSRLGSDLLQKSCFSKGLIMGQALSSLNLMRKELFKLTRRIIKLGLLLVAVTVLCLFEVSRGFPMQI